MLEVASERLTERERECLKHFRQAQECGLSFAEYCRSSGLKANEWHAVRHGMGVKALMPRVQGGGVKKKPSRKKRARFMPVRVKSSAVMVASSALTCRVRHPSGCVVRSQKLSPLECLPRSSRLAEGWRLLRAGRLRMKDGRSAVDLVQGLIDGDAKGPKLRTEQVSRDS